MSPVLPSPLLPILALAGALSCSCGQEPAQPTAHGPILHLLARRPDTLFEQPGVVVLQGDVPGTATWGASEGPGWAQELFEQDGLSYRTTNQPEATLFLAATGPADRDLRLGLWRAHAAHETPQAVHLVLNGIELTPGGLTLATERTEVRVHAPAAAWVRGANRLDLRVAREGSSTWDTLALVGVEYGPAARVSLDVAAERLELVPDTGVRYAVELASEATLRVNGTSRGGAGTLHVRTGSMDPRDGTLEMEARDALALRPSGGRLQGELALAPRAGAVRLIELEWTGGADALVLEHLDVTESRPVARPPLVLISIDTFAASHLSLYGYGRKTSPRLEALCAQSIVFEHCLANAPWTLPSYLSLMSGLYPRAHSVALDFQPGASIDPWDLWQLADNRWTLAEALRARGYRTGAFVDTYWLSPQYGVSQGFDTYNGDAALIEISDVHAGIELIVDQRVGPWLDAGRPERPPFLFVHALDAHGPYLPEPPYRDAFQDSLGAQRTRVPAGSDNQTYRAMPWWMSRTLQPDESIPEEPEVPLEEVVVRYDEALLKVDTYMGKLFDLLKARDLFDEAVIVVTGDHGEHFGPGAYGHGILFEDVLHVPLLVKLPHGEHGGLRVQRPVALVDLYPTLLALAGRAPEVARLHGLGLLDDVDLPDVEAARGERPLFSEGGHVEQYALTQGCWRLIEERPGSESSEASLLTHPRVPDAWLRENCPEILERPLSKELLARLQARPGFAEKVAELRRLVAGPYYTLLDLCAEGGEARDLSAAEPEVLARMKALLEEQRKRSRDAARDANPSAFVLHLSEAARANLEDIGYGGDQR